MAAHSPLRHPFFALFSGGGIAFALLVLVRESAYPTMQSLANSVQSVLQSGMIGLVAGGLVLTIWKPRVARRLLVAGLTVLVALVSANLLSVVHELINSGDAVLWFVRVTTALEIALTGIAAGVVAAVLATTIEALADEPD